MPFVGDSPSGGSLDASAGLTAGNFVQVFHQRLGTADKYHTMRIKFTVTLASTGVTGRVRLHAIGLRYRRFDGVWGTPG